VRWSQAFRADMEGVLTYINFSQPEGGDPKGWCDPHPLISRHPTLRYHWSIGGREKFLVTVLVTVPSRF
jgi:hypothetical protein